VKPATAVFSFTLWSLNDEDQSSDGCTGDGVLLNGMASLPCISMAARQVGGQFGRAEEETQTKQQADNEKK
jgi:hypothetical protein